MTYLLKPFFRKTHDQKPWSASQICAQLSLLLLTLGLTLLSPHNAFAAIKCNGPYQVNKHYGEISTPYCQDHYLASIARLYGHDVTFQDFRRSYFRKKEICDHIGDDIRVSSICAGVKEEHDYRRR